MTAASQVFMASDTLSTPGFFTAAIGADDAPNPFEASFKAGTATLDRGHDSHLRHVDHHTPDFAGLSSNNTLQPIKANTFSPLFGFSPRMSPMPYENRQIMSSKTVDMPAPALWSLSKQEHPVQLDMQSVAQIQAPSPPSSVKHSPDQWQFHDLPEPVYSQLHQILTQTHHGHTRSEYGQVTPPDDRSPEDGDSHRAEHDEQFIRSGRAAKRKRGSPSQPAEVTDRSPSKRQRKTLSQPKSQPSDVSETSISPVEDPKRSKFLERNRVAASKCRQKKKEWTTNLEARARDLQSSKNQLTVVVASLKEEIIFLKGEMLKHSTCGCAAIRDYLNREVASMSQSVYDRGHLPERASAGGIHSNAETPQISNDVASRKGTVLDDDGTVTLPATTPTMEATSTLASSENIDHQDPKLE